MSRFSFFRRGKQESTKDKDASYADSYVASSADRKRSSQKDPVDPMLPQKKRARRRLVGSLVLALAAIIVLPMIFDSEPKPVRQDLLIDIPAKDKSFPVNKKENAEAQSKAAASETAPANSAETSPVADTATVKPVAPATDETAPKKDSDKEQKVAEEKPAATDPIEKIITANKDVKVDAKTDASTAPRTQDKLMIQVAAFASQKKVDELQEKLTKAGIKSKTQKVAVEDGERIRVRIGPLANKKEVDSMCAKLTKMNLHCTLIAN